MENLCLSSFLRQGHPFHLYTYDHITGVPEGTTIKDARAILPPDRIFKYRDYDSYAGFANLFRYKLLLEKGGYWVDTDIVCLKTFVHPGDHLFASQRRKDNGGHIITANNCIIKAPAGSAVIEYCYRVSIGKNPEELIWGETGPVLLNEAIEKFDLTDYVASPEVFCPVDYWSWEKFLDESHDRNLLSNSQAVHLWNEMWRRANIDKSGDFSGNCIYEQFKKRYLSR